MSVVKGKRSVSKLEFFHNAIILRKKITDLLMRDFGIKDYKRDLKFAIKYENFTLEEQETIEEIFANHDMGRCFIDEYPLWLIEQERTYFMDITRNLLKNIVKANTIYPINISEYYVRRNFQNNAISDCESFS